METEAWILLLAIAFLLGYIIGHRHGKEEGYRTGIVFAPIEMRRRSLEKGRCTVCGTGTGTRPSRDEDAAGSDRNDNSDNGGQGGETKEVANIGQSYG